MAPIFSFVLIIGIAAAILIIYYFIYKRAINRRLNMENETDFEEDAASEDALKTSKTPKRLPDLNQTLLAVAITTCYLCLIAVCSQIIHLSTLLQNNQTEFLNLENSINQRFESLSQMQEAANSRFSSVSVTYGAFHPEDHTSELTLIVCPKAASSGSRMFATLFGVQTELKQGQTGIFSGTFKADAFNYMPDNVTCTLEDSDGTIYTEEVSLDEGFIYYAYLPVPDILSADKQINHSYEYGAFHILERHSLKLRASGEVHFSPESAKLVQSVSLQVQAGDQILKSEELPRGETAAYDIDWDIPLPKGDEGVDVYLETTDVYGYTCRNYLYDSSDPDVSEEEYVLFDPEENSQIFLD